MLPPAAVLRQARELLARLRASSRAASADGPPTARRWPGCRPIRAFAIYRCAARSGSRRWPPTWGALLGKRDILRGSGADCTAGWPVGPARSRPPAVRAGRVQCARQLARQFRSVCVAKGAEAVADPEHPRWLGALLAFAYPIAWRQRKAGGGTIAWPMVAPQFGEADALMKHEEAGDRRPRQSPGPAVRAHLTWPPTSTCVVRRSAGGTGERDRGAGMGRARGVLRAERQRRVGNWCSASEALMPV